jgi:hypothetical protein
MWFKNKNTTLFYNIGSKVYVQTEYYGIKEGEIVSFSGTWLSNEFEYIISTQRYSTYYTIEGLKPKLFKENMLVKAKPKNVFRYFNIENK